MNADSRLQALHEVERELIRATDIYEPMHSPHEGYAVLLEEVHELWALVRASKPASHPAHDAENIAAMRLEAKQVAAMAVRFMVDVAGSGA
jgi:hypothetical protein